MPETIKLLRSTENIITKDKNPEKCSSSRDYKSSISRL